MKRIKKLTLALVVLFVFSCLPGFSNAELTEMPCDIDNQSAVRSIINSKDFSITVIGDKKIAEGGDFQFTFADAIDNINSSKTYKSIWLMEDVSSDLLKSESNCKFESYLDNGYSLYFFGVSDLHALSKVLLGKNYIEEASGDQTEKQAVTFVTKNKNGDYFFGHIFSDESSSSDTVRKTALASTWNRRNDQKYTRDQKTAAYSSLLSNNVYAEGGDYFTVGNSWKCVFGWNQYLWQTPSAWGTYGEWKAGFYLTNSSDGKKYWAMAIEGCMAPNQSMANMHSKSLYYDSHADCNGQQNLLRSYSPKSNPTSDTMNLSVSLGTSSQSISASWPISRDDLTVIDTTDIGGQFMKVTFNYPLTWIGDYSQYARGTSWQNMAIIYQAPTGATTCKFGNGRIASFRNFWMSTESITQAWYTTLGQ